MNAQDDIKKVCKLHGITVDERSELIFDTGCQYAEKLAADWYFKDSKAAALAISKIAGFWNWYTNQWLITDRSILRRFDARMNQLSYHQLKGLYVAIHQDIKAYPGMEIFKTIYKKQNDTHTYAK